MNQNKTIFTQRVEERKQGREYVLGPYSTYTLRADAKHLLFSLARYKFCAKMLAGRERLLEVGCGDALGMEIMLQECGQIMGVDTEPGIIEYNLKNNQHPGHLRFECRDIIDRPFKTEFDAAYSCDVLEHIAPEKEKTFIKNLAGALKEQGVCIVGTPNITASPYASKGSQEEHINLKSHESLKNSLAEFFHNVFIFSMNDEVVHTGFHPMAHYLFALAVGPKQ